MGRAIASVAIWSGSPVSCTCSLRLEPALRSLFALPMAAAGTRASGLRRPSARAPAPASEHYVRAGGELKVVTSPWGGAR
eukprot:scaffold2696_cov390-Prasinococcus_capsulatus_cf.AAC.4